MELKAGFVWIFFFFIVFNMPDNGKCLRRTIFNFEKNLLQLCFQNNNPIKLGFLLAHMKRGSQETLRSCACGLETASEATVRHKVSRSNHLSRKEKYTTLNNAFRSFFCLPVRLPPKSFTFTTKCTKTWLSLCSHCYLQILIFRNPQVLTSEHLCGWCLWKPKVFTAIKRNNFWKA